MVVNESGASDREDASDSPGVPDTIPAREKLLAGDPFAIEVEHGFGAALAYMGLAGEQGLATGAGFMRMRVLIALSGGPDSSALLAATLALSDKLGSSVGACHVNHHMRGADSDKDEAFCASLCEAWSVPLDIRHIRPPGPDKRLSESQLRQMRYQLLTDAAAAFDAHFIAVGHTLDDQIETMLFRLFRGTGLAGLIGMEPARRLTASVSLLRPLLAVGRAECLTYLRRLGIEPRYDASNEDLSLTRNYIRHQIIPAIVERFPGFQARLEQLRQRIVAEDAFLDETAGEAIASLESVEKEDGQHWSLPEFLALPTAIQRRVLTRALKERGIEVSFERVSAILSLIHRGSSSRLTLNSQWDVSVSSTKMRWIDKEAAAPWAERLIDLDEPVRIPGLTILPSLGRALRVEALGEEGFPKSFPPATAWEALVDLSAVQAPLKIRARRPGDVIRPFGMDQKVKLKKYLHNRKADTSLWGAGGPVLVVADAEEVIWVPGVGLSNKVRVTRQPSHRLNWVMLAQDELYFA